MGFEIIDAQGTIHSSEDKEEMEYAFHAMIDCKEYFGDDVSFYEAKEEYGCEWEGDLKLIEVLMTER